MIVHMKKKRDLSQSHIEDYKCLHDRKEIQTIFSQHYSQGAVKFIKILNSSL